MKCAFCRSSLTKFMDMGTVALAGGFLKPEQFAAEKKYPLALGFCPECYAVQVMEPVKPAELFANYFYFSSATETAKAHFRGLADEIARRTKGLVVEVGCNDGVLLAPLKERGVRVLGVDPSQTNTDPAVIHDYFGPAVTERIRQEHGRAEVVVGCNVFAHVEDPIAFTEAARDLLHPEGILILEAHHMGEMVSGLQYDWIYHEHRYYYSLLTLMRHFERLGMTVYDVEPLKTHGGSMRYFVDKGVRRVSERVKRLMREEIAQGLDRVSTFHAFAARASAHRNALREACKGVRVGYGASGRANTLIQYAGLELDCIVDDAPAKAGFYTPGSHIPIVSRADAEKMVLLAWPYFLEIRQKCPEAALVVPLPALTVLKPAAMDWQEMDGIGSWRAA